ncbi:hypothetical protein AWC38_SpisGene18062 [Stylophora pistillata]|uniref:Uncharacterized protein n=1 Tax=Stylophora pistillata TaxID=50429 RepID=A0A2B4RKA2_STYPI|nr:hypothetical protein AWC38_SpisGene18062 [Stylophora pistillata]
MANSTPTVDLLVRQIIDHPQFKEALQARILSCTAPHKFLINVESNSVTCSDESQSSSEESEGEAEQSESGSDSECDSEHVNETSNPETNDEDIRDDSIPLYNGARVSRLGALILVMLFSLRHQLSGKALINLVKVLRALLPDDHKFVASAYLLKKYFADLFGEPAPIRHSYYGNCLGRIRNGQAQCLKANYQNSKKKTVYFLELDLRKCLCQLYRDAEFIKLLGYRFENDFLASNDICDIFIGQEYRKLMQPGFLLGKDKPLNISSSFNTDGVSPFKSSNKQNFWPIFLVINELPLIHSAFKDLQEEGSVGEECNAMKVPGVNRCHIFS